MSSIYRGAACHDCRGEGRIHQCEACGGSGTLACDLCGGDGVRMVHTDAGSQNVQCTCKNGYFTCAACSGGTGVCGSCAGTGVV